MMEEVTEVDDPFLEEILLLALNNKKTQVTKLYDRRCPRPLHSIEYKYN
jgi:hypothetical protein